MLQEPALALESPTEPRQLTAGPDDPMARDDDGDRVLPVSRTDGSRGIHVAQTAGQIAVARGGPVRNGAEGVPDAMLERRAQRFQGYVERGARAAEILGELLPCAREQFTRGALTVVFDPGSLVRRRRTGARGWKVDARESGVRGGEDELADGSAETGKLGHRANVEALVVNAQVVESPHVAPTSKYSTFSWVFVTS